MLSMLLNCGLTVNHTWDKVYKTTSINHTHLLLLNNTVHKTLSFTYDLPQMGMFFYTGFQQVINRFRSVNDQFVHIMHIAYKKNKIF